MISVICVISMICKICGQEKENNLFERKRGRPTKLCRSCKYQRSKKSLSYKDRKKRSRLQQKEARKIGKMVYNAIKRGKIVRGSCLLCGESNAEAHHNDYSKPFDLVWLCNKHHLWLHGMLSRFKNRCSKLELRG